jgi:adenosylcobinamide-GDP ribazoletransferase
VIHDLRLAVAFLTRIPAHDPARPLDAARLSRAALWFPAVGLIVGGVMGAVRVASDLVLPTEPATVLALLAAVIVTGGFHEDGLADASDGMGAHVSRERRLEIFKDSRVGTYGALAAVFMVLFSYAVLAPLDGGEFVRAALAGHVLGRWSTLPQSLLLPPAAGQGSGGLVRASAPVVLGGTVVAVGVALLAGGLVAGAIAVATALVLTGLGGTYFRARLGGVTGDTFGAVNKVVELGTYAALAAVWAA